MSAPTQQALLMASAAGGGGGPCDPYWGNVALLMGFEGANGSTGAPGMNDEVTGNTAAVLAGSSISTAQFKFGSSALLQSSSQIHFGVFSLGSSPFTIELWVNFTSVAGQQFFVGVWQSSGDFSWVLNTGGSGNQLSWNWSPDGTTNNAINAPWGPTTGVWYAIAVDFDGTKLRLYVNGTMVGSTLTYTSVFNSPNNLSIGSNQLSNAFHFAGYMDELRITKGVARYASDSGYTVQTAPFPRISCGCPAASAFLARTSGLDAAHQTAYTNLICGLVADGVWSKLDMLHIYATQDSTTALLNLVSTNYIGTAHGSPAFTADRGFTGAGTGVYIDTSFNPTTAVAPHFVGASAHLSVWNLTNATNSTPAIGHLDGSGNPSYIIVRYPNNNSYVRINGGTSGDAAATSNTGHILGNRSAFTGAGCEQLYNNAGALSPIVDTGNTLVNLNMSVLGYNNNGTSGGCALQLAMASIGGSLSSTDVTNFYGRLRTYMTAVGVP